MPSRQAPPGDTVARLQHDRERLRKAHEEGLPGRELVRALAAAMDAATAALWEGIAGDERGLAIVALGGYGRGELSPFSDVDLMVLHDGHRLAVDASQQLFYALWDAGLEVGHATRTIKESVRLAASDVEAATSLLDARFVAGDARLGAELIDATSRQIRKRAARFLDDLANATRVRHDREGHASYLLEPNLKDGAGGLRDLHTIRWIRAAAPASVEEPSGEEAAELEAAAELLHRVRNHLHYLTGRHTDVLALPYQAATAEFLGFRDVGPEQGVDAFLRRLYASARAVEHAAAAALAESRAGRGRAREPAPGMVARNGFVALSGTTGEPARPEQILALFAVAAETGKPVEPSTIRRLRRESRAGSAEVPWTDAVRERFFALLAAGCAPTLQALDHAGLLSRLIPEWENVRCRPQHNIYHRYTVDVHAFETVASLVALGRNPPDPLPGRVWADVRDKPLVLLAGLLHDAGKGLPGDHSVAGERLARSVASRIGLDDVRTDSLAWLVRHHLLLVDAATRRDLHDENLLAEIAAAVRDAERLRMLFVLTVSDSVATGPAAWSPWKAALVTELFTKLLHLLERGHVASREAFDVIRLRKTELAHALTRYPEPLVAAHLAAMPGSYFLAFPTTDLIRHFALMQGPLEDDVRLHASRSGEGHSYDLVLVAADRPGLFSKASGALALNGLSIVSAQVFTRHDGLALEIFRVVGAFEPEIPKERWGKVAEDIRLAMRGRISLDLRLREKRDAYPQRPAKGKRRPPEVVVDNRASDFHTVIEVHAADRIGLLYAITRALADLELDVAIAKVATYAEDVVDVFYVRDLDGQKVTDAAHIVEIERSVLMRLAE